MTKAFEAIVPAPFQPVYDGYAYAPAVVAGDQIHLSGLIGFNLDGSVPEALDAQIQNIFDHMEAILGAASSSLDQVFSLTSYHVGGLNAQMPIFIDLQRQRLGRPHPAWTAIGVNELALPGALLEVSAIALTSA